MLRTSVLAVTLLFLSPSPAVPQPADSRPEWWRGAVCYEIFVRSWFDSDGDGVGDLPGLAAKLPYLRDLGVNCLWLMPIAQSPSYHGYDVTNYYQVNRDYGSNEDFRRLMTEAHGQGIRVVVDLVLNHASSEHPYFKSALLDRDSPWRDWFLWSPTERKTIGWSVPAWHKAPDRNEYYYGIFWQGMPDLNLANPDVTAEAKKIARYWLDEMHVDGFRFDAVGLFFEDGDNPRNGSGTHPWLRDYAAYIKQVQPASFTVGEVWDSVEAMRAYYPDQLDAYFAFPLADAVIDAARSGSSRSLLFQLAQIQRAFPAGRYGAFLRNHDQTRTMTELNGDFRRARLAATLLLTLPGNSVRLLRRGDRDDGRQARSAPPHSHALEPPGLRGIHHRTSLGAAATRFAHGERRGSGWRSLITAQPLSHPDPSPARPGRARQRDGIHSTRDRKRRRAGLHPAGRGIDGARRRQSRRPGHRRSKIEVSRCGPARREL